MIIDLQRRIAEVGRIRIGQTVGSGKSSRPTKLDTFRLTSADRNRIHQAAILYGGQPHEWDAPAGKQWQIITDTDVLNVIVPPSDMAFSQDYEMWSGGGCQRRCDGVNESISDGPCLCDPDDRACKIHTRLSVMLRDLPGLGVWRIDTNGYYAAVELQGAVEIVQIAAGRGHMLPARLRLEQRMVKRAGQTTKRFAVPVLDIEVSPAQLLGGAPLPIADGIPGTIAIESPAAPLTPVPETVPESPAASVAEQAAPKERKPRKNAAQPIARSGLKPRTAAQARAETRTPDPNREADEAQSDPGPRQRISFTPDQRRKGINFMFALFADGDIAKDNREDRLIVTDKIIGRHVASSEDLTNPELYTLVNKLREWKENNTLGSQITEILNQHTLAQLEVEKPSTVTEQE
ncbi:recombination directionality factor [Mycobacterium malmoense]|uniref:recombination directionality factor n=1 Tax=Mycobacterium malmoense TaxID=1780 RepID=UPI0008F971C9|nr:hypothetical protein [Mycobacterium malmoense]OIN80755.1 hypothetical protein BMG05_10430 [Mycobacterium malmoense]